MGDSREEEVAKGDSAGSPRESDSSKIDGETVQCPGPVVTVVVVVIVEGMAELCLQSTLLLPFSLP